MLKCISVEEFCDVLVPCVVLEVGIPIIIRAYLHCFSLAGRWGINRDCSVKNSF